MKQIEGIVASDGLNKKRHYFSFEVLEGMYHDNWKYNFPVGINHDRTKPIIGAGHLSGVYFEPGKAYVTSSTFFAENESDNEQFASEFKNWTYQTYVEKHLEDLKRLEHQLEGFLSTEKTVAPIAAVAFIDKGIVLRVFPKLEELIDDTGLIDISMLDPVLPGVFKKDGLLLFASSYLRRNCSRGNSLNSEFLKRLQMLSGEYDALRVKVRLDLDMIGLNGTQHEELEYSYWWGPKFTDELEDIQLGVTKYHNDNYNSIFSNIDFTEFGWYYQDGNKTLEIEEVVDEVNIHNETLELIGCRYIHSFVNPETSLPTHLDGAIRAYSEEKMVERMDTSLDKTERDTVYTKLWRIDGDIPVALWKELITHYFRDNKLIGEYFHGEDETKIEMLSTTEVVPDFSPIEMDSFIPANLISNSGLRVFFSFGSPLHFSKHSIGVKTTRFASFGTEEPVKVMDAETITLVKLIRRNGASIRMPFVKCVAFEEAVTNYPIFECLDDENVSILLSSILQLYDSIAVNDTDRLLAFSFAININDNESITISIAGHITDYIKLMHSFQTSFSSAAYLKWLSDLYLLNSSLFSAANLAPSPFLLKSRRELRFDRKLVPPRYMSNIKEDAKKLTATITMPADELSAAKKNGISIASCYLVDSSICLKCNKVYRTCRCIKHIDDGVEEKFSSARRLFFFWTNRHSEQASLQ